MTNHPNRKKIKPTAQQAAFVDVLKTETCHVALIARAGTGKTSTILLGVDEYAAMYPDAEILVLAYNKAIADEVRDKLRAAGHTDWRKVSGSTIHSLGFGLLKFLFKPEVDANKVRALIDSVVDTTNSEGEDQLYRQYGVQIRALVAMAKQAGFGFFPDLPIEDAAAWHKLADHFDIDGLDDTTEAADVVAAAQRVYRMSLEQTDVVDYDDMILMPLVKNLRVKFTKDLIFLDEAQDLSRARQALARKFLSKRGRMVVVGDDRQAIYGFSGADAAALDNLVDTLGAKVMPLSISWRCPRRVIELAQTIVPDIEPAPSAAEGEILHVPTATRVDVTTAEDEEPKFEQVPWYTTLEAPLGPTDAILCRNTAPLIALAYQLIRAKVPCKVEGRAIGEGLKNLARRWKIKTISALTNRLEQYAERERQKALAKGNEAKAEEVADRVGTLKEICEACTEAGQTSIDAVIRHIDDLFTDGAENVTVLATYHRSKGREWPRVFLLEHEERCPSRAARRAWQIKQEHNLAYVAFTRAQQSLMFVG